MTSWLVCSVSVQRLGDMERDRESFWFRLQDGRHQRKLDRSDSSVQTDAKKGLGNSLGRTRTFLSHPVFNTPIYSLCRKKTWLISQPHAHCTRRCDNHAAPSVCVEVQILPPKGMHGRERPIMPRSVAYRLYLI